MLLFHGTDIYKKYVIVSGKQVFKFLIQNGIFNDSYDWCHQRDLLSNIHRLFSFESLTEASAFAKSLPKKSKFKDARIKLMAINLSRD